MNNKSKVGTMLRIVLGACSARALSTSSLSSYPSTNSAEGS